MKSYIECVAGLTGGGKSFTVVERMLEHIAAGGVVYSNIRLELDPWFNESYQKMKEFYLVDEFSDHKEERKEEGVFPVKFTGKDGVEKFVYNSKGCKDFLRRFRRWEYQEGQYNYIEDSNVGAGLMDFIPAGDVDHPVLVVLDEALDHFESGDGNTSSEFRSFLRHTRKLGVNLIFIAQDYGDLDRKIRNLVHFVWEVKDMKFWKVPVFGPVLSMFGTGGALPLPWSDNIHTRQWNAKQFGKAKATPVNKRQWVFRDTLIFQCYQSVSLHNSGVQLQGKASDFRGKGRIELKGRKVKPIERILIYAALIAVSFFVFKSSKTISEMGEKLDIAEKTRMENVKILAAQESLSVPPAPGLAVELEPVPPPEVFCSYLEDTGGRVEIRTMKRGREFIYKLGGWFRGRKVIGISGVEYSVTLKDQESGSIETIYFPLLKETLSTENGLPSHTKGNSV